MTQKIQAKNRIKNLEADRAKIMGDAQQLYAIATHQRAYIVQQRQAEELLTGVSAMGFAFMSAVLAWAVILYEVNK